jgi:hypothetical protein
MGSGDQGLIEITMMGVEFSAEPFETEDRKGQILSFRDPESGIMVIVPATDAECKDFVRKVSDE